MLKFDQNIQILQNFNLIAKIENCLQEYLIFN